MRLRAATCGSVGPNRSRSVPTSHFCERIDAMRAAIAFSSSSVSIASCSEGVRATRVRLGVDTAGVGASAVTPRSPATPSPSSLKRGEGVGDGAAATRAGSGSGGTVPSGWRRRLRRMARAYSVTLCGRSSAGCGE